MMSFWLWFAPLWLAILLGIDWYFLATGNPTLTATIRMATVAHPLTTAVITAAVIVGLVVHLWFTKGG